MIRRVTAIFTSRFILDLHEAADTLAREDTIQLSDFGTLPSLVFRTQPSRSTHARRASRSIYDADLMYATSMYDWDESYDLEDAGVHDTVKESELVRLGAVGIAS